MENTFPVNMTGSIKNGGQDGESIIVGTCEVAGYWGAGDKEVVFLVFVG